MMKISIVIPVYNSEKFLPFTLDSILRQDYGDYEVIVMENESTDKTHEILMRYQRLIDNRIKVKVKKLENEPMTLNRGFALAQGDILAYIDHDDVYEPHCFSSVVKYFDEHLDTDLVFGKARIIDKDGNEARSHITGAKSLFWGKPSLNSLLCLDYIVQPTVFFSRRLWNVVGQFNTEDKLCFDYEYWLRAWCIYGFKPHFINQYLASWRVHPDAMSIKNQKAQIRQAFEWQRHYASVIRREWLLPMQGLVYGLTNAMYSGMGLIEK